MDVSRYGQQPNMDGIAGAEQELDFDMEYDITNEDELSDADEANNRNKKRVNRKSQKSNKQKESRSSTSVAMMHQELDLQDLYRKAADKTQKKPVNDLQKKIEDQFTTQMKQALQEKFQHRTADLIQDKVTVYKQKELESLDVNENQLLDQDAETGAERQLRSNQEQTKKVAKKSQEALSKNQERFSRMDKHSTIKEYVVAFSSNLLKNDQKKKEDARQLKQQMLEKGVSTKQVIQIEKAAQSLVNKDLKKLLKKNFLNVALSFKGEMSSELLNNYSKYYSILDVAKDAKFFDANPDGLSSLREEVKGDIRSFLSQELDRQLTETKLKSDNVQDLIKMFDQFNDISKFAKFDVSGFVQQLHKKIDDQGLAAFISPDVLGPVESEQQNAFNQQQGKRDQQHHESDAEDEETKLMNLYIQSNMSHKFFDWAKLKYGIMKEEKRLKNSLNLEEVKKKAAMVAIMRLKLELRQLFELRATLPELKGPQYDIFKKRLKQILKSLAALKNPVSAKQLKELRDQSNRSMFSILKEEYIKLEVFLETDPKNSRLQLKKKEFIAILERLKKESNINASIKAKLMQDLHFLSDVNIIEAA